MGNNPVIGVDPDGEFFFVPILIGAAIGATANVAMQAINGNINGAGDFFAAAGIGALAGGLAVAAPQAIATIGTVGLTTSTGAIASGVLPGAFAGGIGGFVGGFGNAAYFQDADLGDSFKSGLFGAGFGAVTGGVIGGLSTLGPKSASNFWGAPKGPGQTSLNPQITREALESLDANIKVPETSFRTIPKELPKQTTLTGKTQMTGGSNVGGNTRLNLEISPVSSNARLLNQFSSRTIDDAIRWASRPEKLTHIFAPKHNLGPLTNQLGGQQNTLRAVLNAANGKLPASGVFNNIPVNVNGYTIFLRGSVHNGIPKLGTMFIP